MQNLEGGEGMERAKEHLVIYVPAPNVWWK